MIVVVAVTVGVGVGLWGRKALASITEPKQIKSNRGMNIVQFGNKGRMVI
jgi:hypothetical protein